MEIKKAIITATKEQLKEVGCDRDLMGLELEVTEIDKWVGMYGKNSTVHYIHDIGLDFRFNEDYMIPTQWLKFK